MDRRKFLAIATGGWALAELGRLGAESLVELESPERCDLWAPMP
jgi:hypothetical protein